MELHDEDVERLFELVICQKDYLGDVCPTEHIMVTYESGALPEAQRQRLELHMAACPSCREEFIALGQNARWFRNQEVQIVRGLASKGRAAGLAPWSQCPAPTILSRYARKQIPASGGGKLLAAEIDRHLDACPWCVAFVNEFREAIKEPPLTMRQVASLAIGPVLDRLRGLGEGLLAAAQAVGTAGVVRAAPGYRSPEVPTLDVAVLDEDRSVVVDGQGRPSICRFEVVQAATQADGFFTIDLSVAGRAYHRRPERAFLAQASLWSGGICLDLGDTEIDEEGRLAFTGLLQGLPAIDTLSLSCLDLTVRPKLL